MINITARVYAQDLVLTPSEFQNPYILITKEEDENGQTLISFVNEHFSFKLPEDELEAALEALSNQY